MQRLGQSRQIDSNMKTISGTITQVTSKKISVQSVTGVVLSTRISSKTIITLNESRVTYSSLSVGQSATIIVDNGWAKSIVATSVKSSSSSSSSSKSSSSKSSSSSSSSSSSVSSSSSYSSSSNSSSRSSSRSSSSSSSSYSPVIKPLLSNHVIKDITTRVSGLIPSNVIKMYTIQDHATPNYVRNTGCWCNGIVQQLTCMSPWNSSGSNTRAGTVISPRHIIFANHYQIGAGATVRFVTADNQVVSRTMTGSLQAYSDLQVGILDSDLPSSISFCKVAPPNLASYIAVDAMVYSLQVPSMGTDQEEKALISVMRSNCSFAQPSIAAFTPYYEEKIVGDSGNPAFLIINGELMLLTTWWYGGGGSGPSVYSHNVEINAAMATLGGGYQVTPMDLSSFKTL